VTQIQAIKYWGDSNTWEDQQQKDSAMPIFLAADPAGMAKVGLMASNFKWCKLREQRG